MITINFIFIGFMIILFFVFLMLFRITVNTIDIVVSHLILVVITNSVQCHWKCFGSDNAWLCCRESQINSDESVSSQSSVGGGLYHSHSNPDLSTTGAYEDVRTEFPEHVLKVRISARVSFSKLSISLSVIYSEKLVRFALGNLNWTTI